MGVRTTSSWIDKPIPPPVLALDGRLLMNAGANSISRRFTCRSHLDDDAVPGVADDLLLLDFGVWVAVPPALPLVLVAAGVLGATSLIRLFRRDTEASRSADDRRVASDSFFLAILALADDSA